MRIALVDGTLKHTYYPFGLLRLSSMLKDEGHEVKLFYKDLPAEGEWDQVWISAIFTFEIPYVRELIRRYARKSKVFVGGVSPTIMPQAFENEPCTVNIGKNEKAETYPLDYSALGFPPEYSMSKITDGCIRKCGFCAVHKLEPAYVERPNWKRDILPTTKYVVFSDNNYTVRKIEKMREDAEYFNDLIRTTRNRSIDFNQALDARLMTGELAEILGSMPISPMRFSYDGPQEKGHVENAIRLMSDYGKKNFTIYMLYNYMDKPEDAWIRAHEMVSVAEETGTTVCVFPMRYQPIDQIDDKREYTGRHWTPQEKKAFMTMLNHHSLYGQISFSSVAAFEDWFMDSPEKFVKMLNYPKIAQYYSRKKGYNRAERYQERSDASGEKENRFRQKA